MLGMFAERVRHNNAVKAGLLVGALLLSGCGANHRKQPADRPAPPPRTHVLKAGDKVTDTHFLKVGMDGHEKRLTLRPAQTRQPEDLGVIYSPDVSQTLMDTTGDSDPNHAVGMALREYSGKVSLSFVFFELKSEKIVQMSPAERLSNGEQMLFGYLSDSRAYELTVDPTGDRRGDVIVDFKPLADPGNGAAPQPQPGASSAA